MPLKLQVAWDVYISHWCDACWLLGPHGNRSLGPQQTRTATAARFKNMLLFFSKKCDLVLVTRATLSAANTALMTPVARWPGVWTARPHLVSYFDSFLSSQAVLPPPKFCFAVLSNPWNIKSDLVCTAGIETKNNSKQLYTFDITFTT